ncbi:glycosyltransferase [uncultured Adlercreutzia sp.]|uniref:glycosyltransferase n=1 Tax=uncultured Adlercreutzia sp. TaxID=875803 RepID=UPI0025EE4561|nr:glycosyltransferase [uncultured Adlercreutzia sp.]MCI9262890.1 glycosyltransferase [Eggerthellaceae bacterium]
MSPLISVIIPMHNAERYLEECLDSILAQTIDDYEVIIVDDASSDESRVIANSYAKEHPNFKVESHCGNAGSARNQGMNSATGDFLIFLDSDDFFESHMLEKALRAAQQNDADIVLFGARNFDTNSKAYTTQESCLKYDLLPNRERFSPEDVKDNLFQVINPAPWTKMFRRSFIEKTSLRFQELDNSNDVFFSFAALANAGSIAAVRESFVSYRMGTKGSTQDTKLRKPLCFLEALKALEEHLVSNSMWEDFADSFKKLTISLVQYNLRTVGSVSAQAEIIGALRTSSYASLRRCLGGCFDSEQDKKNQGYITACVDKLLGAAQGKCFLSFPRTIESTCILQDDPLLSIVIPVYNARSYIEETLSSLAPLLTKGAEVICVDDGSSDDSLDFVMRFAGSHANCLIVSQSNAGLSRTRNVGLEYARGQYVHFLDSDDLIEPNVLMSLCERARSERADLLLFDGEAFYESDDLRDRFNSYETYYHRDSEYAKSRSGIQMLVDMVNGGDYLPSACLYLMRRAFLADHRLSFYEGILHEDNLFTFQCLLQASCVVHSSERPYLRRVREGSTMTMEKTMAHAYGYYVCWKEMSYLSCQHRYEWDYETECVVNRVVAEKLASARSSFKGVSKKNRHYGGMPLREIEAFKKCVCQPVLENKKLLAENRKLKKEIRGVMRSRLLRMMKPFSRALTNLWATQAGDRGNKNVK